MISQQMIPEFTDENIKKRFSDASTIEQIKLEMEKQIKNYKHSSELVQSIDAYISQCQQYMTVALPKTIIDAEIKSRKDALIKKI
jgi:FKBP-type peptidyl-prolyl cis-trans isomerase (trigger factor)